MDLIKRVEKLKSKIKKHRNDINNETATRYTLIDPVLKELGWHLDDPVEVRYEEGDGGRWDYKLGDRVLIEAKKLGGLKSKDEDQLISYLQKNNMEHGVLTDGNVWQKFTVSLIGHDQVTGQPPYDQDFLIEITRGNSAKISKWLSDLDRDYIMRTVSEVKKVEASEKLQGPGVPISRFRPDVDLPVELTCGDNPPITCNYWIDVLVGVAEYLVDNGSITRSDYPLVSGPKNAILNTRGYHQTGIKMKSSKRLKSGLYLNTNLNPKGVMSTAKKLIKHAGLDMAGFRIDKPDATRSAPPPTEKQQGPGVPISRFRPDGVLPVQLVCRDNPPITCNYWIDVLVGVTDYLIDRGRITKSDCPLVSGPKNAILNTREYHQTGAKMRFSKRLKLGLYLNTNLNPQAVVSNARKIIKHAGLGLDDFRITKLVATRYDSSSLPAPVKERQGPFGVPLSQFRPDVDLPVELTCEGKPPVICNHWIDVLVEIVEHLIDGGYITESRCPFPPGLKNPFVTVESKDRIYYKLVRDRFFLYIKLDKFCILRNATRLIEHSGLDQSDFRIRVHK